MWPACLKELFGAGIFGDFIIPNRLAAQRLRFTFLSLMLIAKARKGDGGVVALAEESPEPCLAAIARVK